MEIPNTRSAADKRFEPVQRSKTFNRILDTLKLRNKKVLDLGCGFGEYLISFGKGSVGITSTIGEVEYGKDNGIQIFLGNVELIDTLHLPGTFDAIWSNNLLEHLLSPHSFLIKLKTVAQDQTLLVLGVPVVPRIASLLKVRKFRGALAAAHINFFTRETLRYTVEKAGWKVQDIRPFTFQNKLLDLIFSFFAPHLYVIAYNDGDFRYPEKKLKEWENEPLYHDLLTIGKRR